MLHDISNERLGGLDAKNAVALIEDIIHADAQMSSIRPTQVSIPHNIHAADGGIDAKVTRVKKESVWGAIKEGTTCYQIKSGAFKPTPTNIKRLLYTNGTLKEQIKKCFECDGTFILVMTGYDSSSAETISDKIRTELGQKYKSAKIDVWTQSTLRGFLKRIPRLQLEMHGVDSGTFMTYRDWSAQDDMANKAELGTGQIAFIEKVRRYLGTSSDGHLRITADPGIGKTKLVLEALKPEPLSTSCIYVDKPSEFLKSATLTHLTQNGTQCRTVLVVDECDENAMTEIWRMVKPHHPKLQLVTIYNEHGIPRNDMKILHAPPLNDEQIINILKSYNVDVARLGVWCAASRPSPRAAHVIGSNLQYHPEDIFRSPGTVQIWDRYIASKERLDSDEFKIRKKVLLWISIFRRIGFGDGYASERKILEDMLGDDGIEKHVFASTVNTLREMRILQGDTTLYITPKILHIYLWRLWNQQYRDTDPFQLDSLLNNDTDPVPGYENVLKWHAEMFPYAGSMGISGDDSKSMFAPGGFADRHNLLDCDLGADMFHSLSKADVEGAVGYLERQMKRKDGNSPKVRRQVVMVLEGAAMKRELFYRAANLLLSLSQAKSEPLYNTAAEAFVNLFQPLSGQRAQTEMPPSQRVPLLRDTLSSAVPHIRRLGIGACRVAMASRVLPPLRIHTDMWPDYHPWTPKSNTDVSEYAADVLKVMRPHMGRFTGEEKQLLFEVILRDGVALLAQQTVADTIIPMIEEACREQHVSAETILDTISHCADRYHILHMPETVRNRLDKLQDMVVGSEFDSMLKLGVGESYAWDQDRRQWAIEKLARQSLDIRVLEPHLDWLMTDAAVYGYQFGHALGLLDESALLPAILDTQKQHKSSSARFLGGYIRALFDRNRDEWEGLMDRLCQDSGLRAHVPSLTAMSGITDRAAVRIRNVIRDYNLDPSLLKPFTTVNLVGRIPELTFQEWIRLLDESRESSRIRLNLYWQYYVCYNRRMPHSVRRMMFSTGTKKIVGDPYQTRNWCGVVEAYLKQHPEDAGVLPDALKLVAANLVGSGAEDAFWGMLVNVASRSPASAWDSIAALLEPTSEDPASIDNENHHLVKYLLSGVKGKLVDKISIAVMCDWIDEDVDKRAPLVAYLLPDRFDLAMHMASRYGKVHRVSEALIFNQLQCGFGTNIQHHEQKIKEIEQHKQSSTNSLVCDWLEQCRSALVRDRDEYVARRKWRSG